MPEPYKFIVAVPSHLCKRKNIPSVSQKGILQASQYRRNSALNRSFLVHQIYAFFHFDPHTLQMTPEVKKFVLFVHCGGTYLSPSVLYTTLLYVYI